MSTNSLAETYSRSLGLSIDKPFIFQTPYGIPFNDYIVIHNSSGNSCKNYDYYQEVVNFINKNIKINIIQLGGKDDIRLEGCLDLCGKTNLHQTAFIIAGAKLLIGNDSQLIHIGGALSTPIIGLYGPTSIECHGPYWKDRFIGIESHRDGKLPSYRFNENPKTINFIKPEEVISAVIKILELDDIKLDFNTIKIGELYNTKTLEVVMDNFIGPESFPNAPFNIRYDYHQNLDILNKTLHTRKCLIYTDVEIDLNLLKYHKDKILILIFNINEKNSNPNYFESLKKIGINFQLVSFLDDEKLNSIKIDYFDIGNINKQFLIDKNYIKNININNLYFKTNKLILSNNKIYPSNAHRLLDIEIKENNEIIDTSKFWEESNFFLFYEKVI